MTEGNVSATVGMSVTMREMSASVGEMSATVGSRKFEFGSYLLELCIDCR